MRKLLLLVLLSVFCFSAAGFSQGAEYSDSKIIISLSDWQKLRQITTRLSTLNSELSNQLLSSQTNLTELRENLTILTESSAALRTELEKSQRESVTLKMSLNQLEMSLTSLETSLNEYKKAARKQIDEAEAQKWIFGGVGLGGGLLIGIIIGIIFL
jgi:chromosome segregation ATPase